MLRFLQHPWRTAAAAAVGLAVAGWGLMAAMDWAAEDLLAREATQSARTWVRLVEVSVTDIDRVLQGGVLSAEAREDLRRHRGVEDVFKFRLFDPSGRLMLLSEQLDLPLGQQTPPQAIGHGSAEVRAMVLGGAYLVMLQHGDGRDRPAIYSEAYSPLRRGGRLLGVVEVYLDQTHRAAQFQHAFRQVAAAALLLLGLVGGVFARLALRQWRAERRARDHTHYLARHDSLSGVLNRTSFNLALAEAVRRQQHEPNGLAVLHLDLDHLTALNDRHGDAAGDAVLRAVGERLRQLVRQNDRVARLGGDEFAILQWGIGGPADVAGLAQRVVAALAQPVSWQGQALVSGGSVGAALYGSDGVTEAALSHMAGLALHRAKQAGGGRFSFYDAATDVLLALRRALTADLHQAVAGEQLRLHYQPLVDIDGHTVLGYEALVRWQHPQRGLLAPDEFIPLAEESGQISALGTWVLRRACADVAALPGGLKVAVNLSPAQFSQSDLQATVQAALRDSGLPARQLELEITESLLLGQNPAVRQTLQALSALGVRIAMDDFGTGHSSLSYLWQFPFHKLKIDRSFTQHLGDDRRVALIVRAIITLAHGLGLRVNAEGVETAAQAAVLRELGCDELQGYLLGRPAPLPAVAEPAVNGAASAQAMPQSAEQLARA